MAQARKKPVAERAAKPTRSTQPPPEHQKKIILLENEIARLRRANERLDRDLTAAIRRVVRVQETVKVLSGLLTELDAHEVTRRQIDDEIPF